MGNKNTVYKSLLIAGAIVIMIVGRENCNCEPVFKIQSLRVIKNRIKIAEKIGTTLKERSLTLGEV